MRFSAVQWAGMIWMQHTTCKKWSSIQNYYPHGMCYEIKPYFVDANRTEHTILTRKHKTARVGLPKHGGLGQAVLVQTT